MYFTLHNSYLVKVVEPSEILQWFKRECEGSDHYWCVHNCRSKLSSSLERCWKQKSIETFSSTRIDHLTSSVLFHRSTPWRPPLSLNRSSLGSLDGCIDDKTFTIGHSKNQRYYEFLTNPLDSRLKWSFMKWGSHSAWIQREFIILPMTDIQEILRKDSLELATAIYLYLRPGSLVNPGSNTMRS